MKIKKGNNMKNRFIPYAYAIMMKELEFDESCSAFYNDKGILEFYEVNCIGNNRNIIACEDMVGKGNKTPFFGDIISLCATAPSYEQTTEWLWDKYNIWIYPIKWISDKGSFDYRIIKVKEQLLPLNQLNYFDSPIIANREGILKSIEYIHSQIKK